MKRDKAAPEKMWAELAPYYDVIYQWKDYRVESERVRDLIERYKLSSGKALLDVACGTGGHIAYLRAHYDVVGMDLNTQMLKVARKKFPAVHFCRGDMISFDLNRKFDVIVCLFSSIAYVNGYAGLKKAVGRFFSHLNPGGIVLIEPFHTRESFIIGAINGGTMGAEGVKISRFNVSRRRGSKAILDFHFLLATKKGVRYFQDLHELSLFDIDKFLQILKVAGFRSKFLKKGLMKGRGLYLGVKMG